MAMCPCWIFRTQEGWVVSGWGCRRHEGGSRHAVALALTSHPWRGVEAFSSDKMLEVNNLERRKAFCVLVSDVRLWSYGHSALGLWWVARLPGRSVFCCLMAVRKQRKRKGPGSNIPFKGTAPIAQYLLMSPRLLKLPLLPNSTKSRWP